MTTNALALRPAADPPLPRTGVAGVTALGAAPGSGTGTARTRAALVIHDVQELLPFADAGLDAPRLRPRLRLVVGNEGEVDRFAAQFAQLLVEVITGHRAVHQLMRWTTDEVYEQLAARAAALDRVAGPRARSGRPDGALRRAQVRSVHVGRPQPGTAELAVHVRQGARSRALAARIDQVEGRWRCSALVIG